MSVKGEDLINEKMEDGPPKETVEETGETKGKPEEGESFKELYEESLHEVQEGEVVHGRVIHIGPEFVTVDVGFKSEGQLPLREFLTKEGTPVVGVGDYIDVFVERKESEIGMVSLSKEKADKFRFWEEISRAWNEDQMIEGKIVSRIKGGLTVDIGVQAFLPGSQIDIRPIRNLEKLIGSTFKFKIIKLNRRRGNVVLSRRILLEKERESQRQKTLEALEEGKIVEGVVKNVTDYGAFIDLGGIDGLMHITDISWGRINHPSEVLTVGSKIKVKILQFDREHQRVSLGLKQTAPGSLGESDSKIPCGNPGERKSYLHHRLRCLRSAPGWGRGAGSCVRDVLDKTGQASFQNFIGGRRSRGDGPGSGPGPEAYLPRVKADHPQPLGLDCRALSGGNENSGADQEPHRIWHFHRNR